MKKQQWGHSMLAIGLVAAVLQGLAVPAMAEKSVKSLKSPLSVQLQTDLDAQTMVVGKPFKAVLTEDHVYEGKTLPAGTAFSGKVAESRDSKRFGRTGFFVLAVDEVTLPNGNKVDLDEKSQKKVHGKNGKSFGKTVGDALPLTVVSSGTSIPLNVASSLSGGIILPIALGARVLAGTVMEWASQDPGNRSFTQGVVGGLDRGTGYRSAREILGTAPPPSLKAGDDIPLVLDPKSVEKLFDATTKAAVTPETPLQNAENPTP